MDSQIIVDKNGSITEVVTQTSNLSLDQLKDRSSSLQIRIDKIIAHKAAIDTAISQAEPIINSLVIPIV